MSARTKIKVCGLTDPLDALAAAEYGADFLGFVFAESPRRLDPARAREFWGDLPRGAATVGVFRNPEVEEVDRVLQLVNLDYLQFHGDESPVFCRGFGRPVIKAVSARGKVPADVFGRFHGTAEIFLVDLPKEETAGSLPLEAGRAAVGTGERILLAGGLTPENVALYVRELRPYGVDVARGVEARPGRKDLARLREFIERARAA